MINNEQAPQAVRIIITGQRSNGTRFEQACSAKAGDRFEVDGDGCLVRVDNPTDTEVGA